MKDLNKCKRCDTTLGCPDDPLRCSGWDLKMEG